MYVNVIQMKLILREWMNALVHPILMFQKFIPKAIPLCSWNCFISTAQSRVIILICTGFLIGVSFSTKKKPMKTKKITVYSSNKEQDFVEVTFISIYGTHINMNLLKYIA